MSRRRVRAGHRVAAAQLDWPMEKDADDRLGNRCRLDVSRVGSICPRCAGYPLLEVRGLPRTPDGLHPNNDGYEVLADCVEPPLLETLAGQ